MADNVIVRVPEQQFIRGEDGYSPVVTVEEIEHGHSVNITDREHPEGQSFPVLDGASAYEQAVAGGYTGTEAQFNEELASFKELSDEMKEVAPFYAEYGMTTKAEIEAAINNKRQIYLNRGGGLGGVVAPYTGTFLYADIWGEGTGYRFARTNGNWQYVYELKSEWTYSIYDLTAPAQRAEAAAATALTRMKSADASAQAAAGSAGDASAAATTATEKAGEASDSATAADGSAKDAEAYAIGKRGGTDVGSADPAYHNNAKYYAQQASGSATAASGSATSAASSATAAGNAQTAAETAQAAAEDAQEAAEAVLASIPADYTELGDAVNGSIVDIDPGTLTPGYVNTPSGAVLPSTSGLGATDFIDIHDYVKIAYLRLRSTSATASTGMCFYDANKVWVAGIVSLRSQPMAEYDKQLTIAEIPNGAYYARFTGYRDTDTYGNFVIKGIKESTPNSIDNVSLSPAFGNIFTTEYALPKIATYADVIAAYDNLVERYPLIFSKNTLTSGNFNNYEYVFSTGNYNTKGARDRDSVIAKPKILLISGVHGDERTAVIGLYHLIKSMCEKTYSLNTVTNFCEYHIIPVVNPSGYNNNTRLNANGVNINRNFASPNWTQTSQGPDYSGAAPADQLETQVVQNWIDNNTDAALFIDCHNSSAFKEVSCLLGLSDAAHLQAKKNYLYTTNELIPYLEKRRNIQNDNIFSYTGNTDTAGASKAYGEYKNIMSFTFETSSNVDQHGKNGEFCNALTCETTGAMLKGLIKYVLLKDPINAAILG